MEAADVRDKGLDSGHGCYWRKLLYNNGITLIVKDFERGRGNKHMLTAPYVVNGCQTTRTIWEVCYKRLNAWGDGQRYLQELWIRSRDHAATLSSLPSTSSPFLNSAPALTSATR